MGGVGQEYVQSVLSTTEPAAAVAAIQRRAGLPDPRTRPLLQLLDQLGRSRWAPAGVQSVLRSGGNGCFVLDQLGRSRWASSG